MAASILDVLKSEREAFFAEHASLSPGQIQRLWETRKTDILAVLDGQAPIRPSNTNSTPKQRNQQHVSQAASHPIPIPKPARRTSVWLDSSGHGPLANMVAAEYDTSSI
jgi:hypothetical protein